MKKLTEEFNKALTRNYHDTLMFEEIKRKYSRTSTSFRGRNAMEWLYKEGGKTMSEIADYLRISRPSATTLIAKLEDLGYVMRSTNGNDKRSEKVTLTRKGQLISAYQSGHRARVIEDISSEFSDDELKIIIRGFNRLSDVFENCSESLENNFKGNSRLNRSRKSPATSDRGF